MSRRTMYKRSGFGILEIVVGASILATVFGAGALFYQEGIQTSRAALNHTQAVFLEMEGLEAGRYFRDLGWANVSGPSDGTSYYLSWTGSGWATSTTPSVVNDIFQWSIQFNDVHRDGSNNIVASGGTLDANTREIASSVSWVEGSATSTRSISTYLSNILSS